MHEVISRPKFMKYISQQQIDTFMKLLLERAEFISTTSVVKVSPDEKNDFLLALCRDGKADYLLTGNKIDLLDLKEFELTTILSLTDFLNLDI
ncbi:putative toxin-antitoxin system toxin component, PIN family [Dyadobacter sp. CY345]|nr:putative toxin-antitoxin system toxin component, PIN family [Dyadobacter sp. CY345]